MKPLRLLGIALAGAGVAAAAGARRRTARWKATLDPDGPDSLRFAVGDERVVTMSDGAHISATVAGEGPTVVLAHGWTNNRSVWAPVARRLISSGHRVIAYDQRGHGQSTTGTDPFTVTRIGSDLRELLVALDVHDAVLAGHSMGGMTIMSLVGEDPVAIKEHACAIVLVATAASGLGRNAALDGSVGRLLTSRAVSRLMGGPLAPHLARSVIGAHPCYSHLEAVSAMWTATPADVIRDAWMTMSEMDLRAGLAGCPVPATVMVGTRDQLTRRGLAQAIAAAIPGAELVTIHGAGHMLPLEEPDQVAEVITRSSVAP